MEQVSIAPEKLKGVGRLLRDGWEVYRSKIKTIFGIMAVFYAVTFMLGLSISYFLTYGWRSVPVVAVMFILLFLANLSVPASLVFALKENIGAAEAFKKSFKVLIPYTWTVSLAGFITMGIIVLGFFALSAGHSAISNFLNGTFHPYTPPSGPFINIFFNPIGRLISLSFFLIFFAALIWFAVMLSIWFSLVTYVIIFEGKKGMAALLRSRDLVAGRSGGVLWRFMAFGLLLIGINLLILAVLYIALWAAKAPGLFYPINDILRPVMDFFIVPFLIVYATLIYRNLADIKKEVPYREPLVGRKLKYILPALAGWALIAFFLVSYVISLFRHPLIYYPSIY